VRRHFRGMFLDILKGNTAEFLQFLGNLVSSGSAFLYKGRQISSVSQLLMHVYADVFYEWKIDIIEQCHDFMVDAHALLRLLTGKLCIGSDVTVILFQVSF
jgi:hypothetical protein